ncbi:hypothetical protein [Pseudoalteromonas rhizosphaerae]|uniref:Uncharacterized protein n=1 Tax=Pseudoalteromonas rhizosphaerae TaxID=2518973 RepID=A0ABW8L257_9GAMM
MANQLNMQFVSKAFERNLPTFIGLFGIYWMLNNFIKKGQEITAPLTKPVSKALTEFQFFVNDSNYIKYPNAGFYLNPAKINYEYKVIDMEWLHAITMTHDDHEVFLNEIFDENLILKPIYRPLIGAEVSAASIATAART